MSLNYNRARKRRNNRRIMSGKEMSKRGKYVWVSAPLMPIKDANGKIHIIVAKGVPYVK